MVQYIGEAPKGALESYADTLSSALKSIVMAKAKALKGTSESGKPRLTSKWIREAFPWVNEADAEIAERSPPDIQKMLVGKWLEEKQAELENQDEQIEGGEQAGQLYNRIQGVPLSNKEENEQEQMAQQGTEEQPVPIIPPQQPDRSLYIVGPKGRSIIDRNPYYSAESIAETIHLPIEDSYSPERQLKMLSLKKRAHLHRTEFIKRFEMREKHANELNKLYDKRMEGTASKQREVVENLNIAKQTALGSTGKEFTSFWNRMAEFFDEGSPIRALLSNKEANLAGLINKINLLDSLGMFTGQKKPFYGKYNKRGIFKNGK